MSDRLLDLLCSRHGPYDSVAAGESFTSSQLLASASGLYESISRENREIIIHTVDPLLFAAAFLLKPTAVIVGLPVSVLAIPLLNILIAAKVALGSWTIVLLFIRHRGLL